MIPQTVRKARILLVEDNDADAEMLQFLLTQNKFNVDLKVIKQGVEALDFIFMQNGYEDSLPPDLILLDIKLPDISGLEILRKIKESEQHKMTPVVILTSSDQEEDLHNSYSFYANCFIKKPLDIDSLKKTIQQLKEFWFSVVALPPK
ncbi:MAG: response regulator [Chlamydiota bacterium]|nr:response regulator [Chlamydiota bacterium]